MLINPITARIEWADRVARQAEQLLIIAKATNDGSHPAGAALLIVSWS
jgi:hypothetical protein